MTWNIAEVFDTMKYLILACFAAVLSNGATAEPLGFDHHPDGTHTAKYKSDSSGDRCSQMEPKLLSMVHGYCGAKAVQPVGWTWCDEANPCIFGLCNHYAYFKFRCVPRN